MGIGVGGAPWIITAKKKEAKTTFLLCLERTVFLKLLAAVTGQLPNSVLGL